MAALTETSPTTFRTSLTYLNDEPKYGTEKPYRLLHPVEATPEVPESNMEFTTHGDILIKDLRGINNDLSLEKNAFKLYNWPSAINPSATYEEIEAYCRAMANLLKYELNAQKTWVFDFRFRSNALSKPAPGGLRERPVQIFGGKPLVAAHTDQTQMGGLERIRRHLTEEEWSKYMLGDYRVRIVNVWRSFNTTAQDMPLAMCMPSSVAPEDLIKVDLVGPEKSGESYYVHYNPQHEWYWASDMKPEEALVFTTWDSIGSAQGTSCAIHTAFPHPRSDTFVAPRESLEIRVIIVDEA